MGFALGQCRDFANLPSMYMLHRLDGRIDGPLSASELLNMCREGLAHGDESISSHGQSGSAKPLSSVTKVQAALEEGLRVRGARQVATIPAVVADLKPSVVQIRTPTGTGSGFAIDSNGTIVTNRHVVEDSGHCMVHFGSGAVAPALVVHRSSKADLAVVRSALVTPNFLCLSTRRGDDVAAGERVLALGFPQDAGFNVTDGMVSAVGVRFTSRELPSYSLHDWIRTSAVINGGNSGGPLIDLLGRVIGMATWGQVRDNAGNPVSGMNYCTPHAVICQELREFRRLVADRKIELPTSDQLLREAHRPDPFAELDLAFALACDRFGLRMVKKVPFPGMNRGFSQAVLASAIGDVVHVFVDSFSFENGPPYVTVYCDIGEFPSDGLKDPGALLALLQENERLPHWNFMLREDGALRLRFSRQLQLLDAVEIGNAIEDLVLILDRYAAVD